MTFLPQTSPIPRNLPGRDVQPVPEVDQCNVQHVHRKLRLVAAVEVIGDPERLRHLDLAILTP
jgi:hypothetical protein